MDQHYTPDELAAHIVRCLDCETPQSAVDFAAGEGALLGAILARWPECNLYATDLSKHSVAKLRRRFPNISAAVCDFLQHKKRQEKFFNNLKGSMSLIFLNPPFSSRGGSKYRATLDGEVISCSKALAFVVASLEYLSPRGTLISLLPSSCLTSERDQATMQRLADKFHFSEIWRPLGFRFQNCSVEIRCVQFRKREPLGQESAGTIIEQFFAKSVISTAKIYRGKLPMCEAKPSKSKVALPLIHTTDLKNNKIHEPTIRVRAKATLEGPAVLIPRVGRPYKSKIALYSINQPVVLSDCIIAVQAGTLAANRVIFNLVKSNWSLIERLYGGSCAKYITLSRLEEVLRRIGVSSEVISGQQRQDVENRRVSAS